MNNRQKEQIAIQEVIKTITMCNTILNVIENNRRMDEKTSDPNICNAKVDLSNCIRKLNYCLQESKKETERSQKVKPVIIKITDGITIKEIIADPRTAEEFLKRLAEEKR